MPLPRHAPQRLLLLLFLLSLAASPAFALQPSAAANAAFDTYIAQLELRLAGRRHSPASFLAVVALPPEAARLRRGELLLEQLTPPTPPVGHGALLHDWRGTAFIPGAHAADFEALLRRTEAYPQVFAPQVLEARTLAAGDHLQLDMRVQQHHGLTVVLDTRYDTTFGHLDPGHAFSTSRSTAITEIANPGTPREHPLSPAEAHGYLWRQNTYWSWQERDGGLYLQLESVSLTRDVPTGLGWLIGSYLESIPRASLAFTLRSASNALTTKP